MATKLYLRNTTNNGVSGTGDGIVYDMITTIGGGTDQASVQTVSGGTQIQWTIAPNSSTIAWISGRAPVGGFTLTTTDISIWARELSMADNCGGRYRVFKYSGGVVTELGGGPFDDGIEFATASSTEMTWIGNVTDTVFAENDRILLRVYITNIGTMGGGSNCLLDFNRAGPGNSFFNIAETVTFKAEAGGAATGAGWWGAGVW